MAKREKPYRDYSDDSWFTQLVEGLRHAGGCWTLLLSMISVLTALGWLVNQAL